ncbi:MAG: hypothetical protein KGL40_12525 [Rhodocyclaceae bacterium]|nr:hypothetical protein [Rhodocyclaceae bacterium]
MDADAFLKQVRPGSQRSRLAPFLVEIRKLRDAGCTLEQVVEFLAKNGVTITVAGLSVYLLRQAAKDEPAKGRKKVSRAKLGQ